MQTIQSKIYEIRGQKVMLDYDLALLYQTETRTLKQAVRRNIDRFPSDFMFELSQLEVQSLRSQIVMSKPGRGGTRHKPFAFTGQGVAMQASILNSPSSDETFFKDRSKRITSNRSLTVTRNCLSREDGLFLVIKPERGTSENEKSETANEKAKLMLLPTSEFFVSLDFLLLFDQCKK